MDWKWVYADTLVSQVFQIRSWALSQQYFQAVSQSRATTITACELNLTVGLLALLSNPQVANAVVDSVMVT